MDLRAHLLALMRPVELGDAIVPGVVLVGASTELGLRLSVRVEQETEVHVEVSPIELGNRHAARSDRLAFAYRSGGAERVDPVVGERVCRAVAQAAARNEADVLAAIAREVERSPRADRVAEIRVQRLLEPAGAPGRRFYTLSPYVGCLIGCRFCYAQSRLDPMRTLLRLPQVPWGSYVDVRINAAEVLAEELRTLPRHPIKFCPIVSDPYQAVERRYALTRACLQTLAALDDPPPAMVMTRSDMIVRDIDVVADLAGVWVGASIPTIDDEVRAHFEPRAASIPQRLAMLRAFERAGVRRCVVVQPILPGPVDALADALADVVDSVSIGVLRGEQGAATDFDDPRYAHARTESWQRDHALELRERLCARGVTVWTGELPPQLEAWRC